MAADLACNGHRCGFKLFGELFNTSGKATDEWTSPLTVKVSLS